MPRTATPRSRAPLPAGLQRIARVARRTGVTEHALRSWERRYGTLASHRSPSGYRLYTEDDVARIRTMKALCDAGFAIGDIVQLPAAELEALRARVDGRPSAQAPLPGPLATVARSRFLAAIERYDVDEAGGVVASAVVAFRPFDFVREVAAPLLVEVGARWQAGTLTVAQEHAASAILRGQLGDLLRAARPRPGAPTIVVTTPDGERHELGALCASVVAADAGARVVYLGPSTPDDAIAAAAARTRADVVAVSLVCLGGRSAGTILSRLRRRLPAPVRLWAGGRALRSAPPRGVDWVRDLEDLRARVLA